MSSFWNPVKETKSEITLKFDGVTIEVLNNILKEVKKMSVEMDNLTAAVARIDGVIPSAVAALQGYAARVEALLTQIANLNPEQSAAIQALADDLTTGATQLAAAVPIVVEPPPPPPEG